MATINTSSSAEPRDEKGPLDPEGFPWLENGERMDQKTFHERYERTPTWFRAELIGGIVYVASHRTGIRHGRSVAELNGWVFLYTAATPGTVGQTNATTILGDECEVQPDVALLILDGYGGQSRDGEDDYTYGPPELIVEVALSSRSIDLNDKLRDYEKAGVREYIVYDLRDRDVRWFEYQEGRFVPLAPDADGLFRSRFFPGLWLDPAALSSGDMVALIAALNRGLASPEHAAFVEELRRRHEERTRS